MSLSTPVVFMIYNRPALTKTVFGAIARAKPRTLLVIADGPRTAEDAPRCAETRKVLDGVNWDCEVVTNYSDTNMGCGPRVSSGLRWALSRVEEAIILEDDCLPSQSFFPYCQQLLEYYRDDHRVTSINGSNLGFRDLWDRASYRFSKFMNMWGWATWRRSIEVADFEMAGWPAYRDSPEFRAVLGGDQVWIDYWTPLFDATHSKSFDTWDYPWILSNLRRGGLVVSPSTNMIHNLGYGADATHTTDPKDRLARLRNKETRFPLRHPAAVVASAKYDDFVRESLLRQFHGTSPLWEIWKQKSIEFYYGIHGWVKYKARRLNVKVKRVFTGSPAG